MIVADFCRRDVVVLDEDKTPLDAAVAMRECQVGDVVVIAKHDGAMLPVGVISDRDIAIEVVAGNIDPQEVSVRDLLIRPLETIDESDDLSQCIRIMKQKALRRLPVVNSDKVLVGIISVDDVIEALSSHINDFAVLFNTPPKRE